MSQEEAWQDWCKAKNQAARELINQPPVRLRALCVPAPEAEAELARRCELMNYALYEVAEEDSSVDAASDSVIAFARRFGLEVREDHRSAGHAGVVALRTSAEESKQGYIPYTTRPLNWHTDGYYNAPDDRVEGFILHCHRQALAGGENQLLDHEIAYMRLREENPDYIRAMMHPEALVIPENVEKDGSVRPASVGPVFFPDPATGRLQMRYTARTRSIEWRDDKTTLAAVAALRDILGANDPLMQQVRMKSGQGMLNNNVLHNRTRFEDGQADGDTRVMLRVRFHVRVAKEELDGAA